MTIINLVCLILMMVGSLVYMGVRKKGTLILENAKELPPEQMRHVNRDSNRLFGAKITTLLITIGSAVQVFLTEDFNYNFKLYNNWSILQIALLLLTIGVMFFGAKDLNKESPAVEEPETDDDWDDEADL